MTIQKIFLLSSAIIENKKGEILFLQRGKNASFQGYWQLPEGKIKKNENPEEALKREVKEEIDQDVQSAKLISVVYDNLEVNDIKYLVIRLIYRINIELKDIKLSDEHSNFKWFRKYDLLKIKLLPGTQELIDLL